MATVIRGDDNFDTADNATQTELDSGLNGKLDITADVGKVLQVVQATNIVDVNTSSTTPIQLGSITITPSSASSKIYVTLLGGKMNLNTALSNQHKYYLYREATLLTYSGYWASGDNYDQPINAAYMDDPNTTSATTYYLKGAVNTSNGNLIHDSLNQVPILVAMEIGA